MAAFPSDGTLDELLSMMNLRSWCSSFKTLFDTYSPYINMWSKNRPAFTVTPHSFNDISQISRNYNAAWTRGSIAQIEKRLGNFVGYDHNISAYGGFEVWSNTDVYDGGSGYNHTITVGFSIQNSDSTNRLRLQDLINSSAKMCIRCVPRTSGQSFTIECFDIDSNGGSTTFDAVTNGMVGGQYYECYPFIKYGSTFYSLPGLTSNSIYINHYEEQERQMTGISITGYNGAINVGDTLYLTVWADYDDGYYEDITSDIPANDWSGVSSFTRRGAGVYRAEDDGTFYINVTYMGYTLPNDLTVVVNAASVQPTEPTGITITNKPYSSLTVGDTHDLDYSLSPAAGSAGYASHTVTWSRVSGSSNVSVNSSTGVVSASAAGTATIRATLKVNGSTVDYDDYQITFVAAPVQPTVPTGITITNKPYSSLTVGDTHDLDYSLSPAAGSAGYASHTVTWSRVSGSSNVSVNSSTGVVSASAAGTATIRATLKVNGSTVDYDDYQITFVAAPVTVTSIMLNKASLSFNEINDYEDLVANVTYSDGTTDTTGAKAGGLSWSSSNSSVATVSSSGRVTAKALGNATITATCGGKSGSCSVSVVSGTVTVTGVSLDRHSLSFVGTGGSSELIATVSPSNATNKRVTWSSSNTSVATVSGTGTNNYKGVVSIVGIGNATITVTTNDQGKTDSCDITVTSSVVHKYITGVTIDKQSMTLVHLGSPSTGTITATITPSDADTWDSWSWTTTDRNIARVTESSDKKSATVRAWGVGECDVKLTIVSGGNTFERTCHVTVESNN